MNYNALLVIILLSALSVASGPGQNLLSDPGFESGTLVSNGVNGWWTVVDAVFSQNYSRSGLWSMNCYYAPSQVHGVSVQAVTATPGLTYTLSGWGFTPSTLGSSDFGSLILFFEDANGRLLGNYTNSSPTYFSSNPILNSSLVGNWIPLSITEIAPTNAATVWAETTLFNPAAGDAVYFDDINLSVVPEPSLLALVGLGTAIFLRWRSAKS
jgi:hypothetical protein